MNWLANAVMLFLVVLVDNWLVKTVKIIPSNDLGNQFVWAAILSLIVGVGVSVAYRNP